MATEAQPAALPVPSRWQDIVGQPLAVRLLRRAVAVGRLAHAYAFIGPEGTGKSATALVLARTLMCQRPEAGVEPCGECVSCRKVAEGNHPELEVLRPEGASHRIDALRALQGRIWRIPAEGKYRVVLLEQAERMQAVAANSLLKVLEEPPPHAIFVLITANGAALLPTVRSRCQAITFPPIPQGVVEEMLVARCDLPPERARYLAALAGGSLGRAIALASMPEVEERRELARALLEGLPGWDDVRCLQAAEELEKRNDVEDVLAQLAIWLRDALVWRESGARHLLVNGGAPTAPGRQAGGAGSPALAAMFAAVEEARRHLQRNANARLTLDVLMLRLQALST